MFDSNPKISPNKLYIYNSPFGDLELGFHKDSLILADWIANPKHRKALNRVESFLTLPEQQILESTFKQLDSYFSRTIKRVTVPFMMLGTGFERRVWSTLSLIPYGQLVSYGEIAFRMGRMNAVRAVASAIGRNPLNIIIPCHRVIAAGNKLGGYAGGIETKRRLIELEQKG